MQTRVDAFVERLKKAIDARVPASGQSIGTVKARMIAVLDKIQDKISSPDQKSVITAVIAGLQSSESAETKPATTAHKNIPSKKRKKTEATVTEAAT